MSQYFPNYRRVETQRTCRAVTLILSEERSAGKLYAPFCGGATGETWWPTQSVTPNS